MKLRYFKIEGLRGFASPLEVDSMEKVTTFVGPNGSGKSTILRALKHLLDFLSKGTVCETIEDAQNEEWFLGRTATLTFCQSDEYDGFYDTSPNLEVRVTRDGSSFIVQSLKSRLQTLELTVERAPMPRSMLERTRAILTDQRHQIEKQPASNSAVHQANQQKLQQLAAQERNIGTLEERQSREPAKRISREEYDERLKAEGFGAPIYIPSSEMPHASIEKLIEDAIRLKKGKTKKDDKYKPLEDSLEKLLQASVHFFEDEKGKKVLTINGLDHEKASTGTKLTLLFFALTRQDLGNSIILWDEPENSLHPTRRYRFLDLMIQDKRQFVLATHSTEFAPILREQTSVFRCDSDYDDNHDRPRLQTTRVSNRRDAFLVAEALGLHPAMTLFTANVVVWVEGPTELYYLRHWLTKRLGPKNLHEGFHYTFMQYGGGLIKHLDACDDPNDQSAKIAFDVMSICRYPIILVDSDLDKDPNSQNIKDNLKKPGARRILEQVEAVNHGRPNAALFLHTHGRETENYLPAKAIEHAVKKLYDYNSDESQRISQEKLSVPQFEHYEAVITRHLLDEKIVYVDNEGRDKPKGHSKWGAPNKVEFMRKALDCSGFDEKDLLWNGSELLDAIANHIEKHNRHS